MVKLGKFDEPYICILFVFLIALCLGSMLWVAKNALFLWLEAVLHYGKLCERIAYTVRQLHVLQILYNRGTWKFLTHARDRKTILEKPGEENSWKGGYNICEELLWKKKETVPVWILWRLCQEYKNSINLKPLPATKETVQDPEKLMDEAMEFFRQVKQHPNNQNSNHQSLSMESDDDEIKPRHLEGKYKVGDEELKLFFKKFMEDPPKDQDDWTIKRHDFCSWAVHSYRNCWGLQSTLKSSERIIVKLNRILVAFVVLLALIIWLLLSEIVDSAQIALIFSPLIAAKFIFSESTKNMFDGLIFALAMHPFNPGDRVVIGGMELLVVEIYILSTTFYKYQTGEELVYPNSELATTQITILESTPDQSDQLEFNVCNTTPLEDIRDLEIKIQMSLGERKDAYKIKVVKAEMGYENIKMTIRFKYVGAYLTSEMKAVHKSDMLSVIMRLQKQMEPSTIGAAPLACKPYIVKVTVSKRKVKLKQIEDNIKAAIERSVEELGKDVEFKVVLNNVTDKMVEIAFYVWKKSLESTNAEKKGQQELISKESLYHIEVCILKRLQDRNYKCTKVSTNGKGQDEVGSNADSDDIKSFDSGGCDKSVPRPSFEVTGVKIQTMPGLFAISLIDNVEDKQIEAMENAIKRYIYNLSDYEDEFEVKISKDKKVVEIYAWRHFTHNNKRDKQLDMKRFLADHREKILDLQELKNFCSVRMMRSISICET